MKKYLAHILFIAMFSGVFLAGGSTASAATIYWDGGGDGTSFSDALNWSIDFAPVDGDNLVFDVSTSASSGQVLDNDIVGLSIAGIEVTGNSADYFGYNITGNELSFTGGITSTAVQGSVSIQTPITLLADVTFTTDNNVSYGDNSTANDVLDIGAYTLTISGASVSYISNTLSGTGSIVINSDISSGVNFFGSTSGFTGDVSVANGSLGVYSGALDGATVTVADGSTIGLPAFSEDANHNFTLNLSGGGNVGNDYAALEVDKCFLGCGGGVPVATKINFAGTLNLGSNVELGGIHIFDITSGTFNANGFTLTPKSGSTASFTSNEGTIESEPVTITIGADDKSTDFVNVGNKQTVVLNGERGPVAVLTGGVLKGTGATGVLTFSGGTVAPGLSPGCLTTDGINTFGSGFLQIELAGLTACTEYDQLVVNATATAVDITGVTLQLQHLGDFTTTADDQFVIVRNLSTEAVTGEFVGMAENSTFVANGMTYRINYNAGEGANDIVLTRIVSPGEPDSGLGPIGNLNTVWALMLGAVLLAGSGVALAKRS